MIKIRIGEAEREFEDVEEGWINQQVNRRQADGLEVCVEVFIKKKDIDLILSTPTCGSSRLSTLKLWIKSFQFYPC